MRIGQSTSISHVRNLSTLIGLVATGLALYNWTGIWEHKQGATSAVCTTPHTLP